MNERELEKILKALANKRRIAILKLLKSKGPLAVNQIAREIKLSLTSTSKHLIILEKSDILEKEQVSLSMIYNFTQSKHPVVKKLLELL